MICSEITFNPLSFERCLYFLAFFFAKKKTLKYWKDLESRLRPKAILKDDTGLELLIFWFS